MINQNISSKHNISPLKSIKVEQKSEKNNFNRQNGCDELKRQTYSVNERSFKFDFSKQEIMSQEIPHNSQASSSIIKNVNKKIPNSIREIFKKENHFLFKNNKSDPVNRNQKLINACSICEKEMNQSQTFWIGNCDHKNHFCSSCLYRYAIYKIQKFEEISCPQEGCPITISQKSPLLLNLPKDIQIKYQKIRLFYSTSKDPSLKLCPKNNCDGTIKLCDQTLAICSACQTIFCKQCFLEIHQGSCDEFEISFFEKQMHFKQCQKCKMMIEKIDGCNHITCQCKYQFCYICGEAWNNQHICGIIPVPPLQQGPTLMVAILKYPLKLILLLLFVTTMVVYFALLIALIVIVTLCMCFFSRGDDRAYEAGVEQPLQSFFTNCRTGIASILEW